MNTDLQIAYIGYGFIAGFIFGIAFVVVCIQTHRNRIEKQKKKQSDRMFSKIQRRKKADSEHVIDDNGKCWCEPDKIECETGDVYVHHDKSERN